MRDEQRHNSPPPTKETVLSHSSMPHAPTTFAFDFDSTLIKVETLDALVDMSLAAATEDQRAKVMTEFKRITDAGMNGELSMQESLKLRLQAAKLSRDHVAQFAQDAVMYITPTMDSLVQDLQGKFQQIIIISGGMTEAILPVASALGIASKDVYANTPIYDNEGIIVGMEEHPLATSDGKSVLIKQLKTEGKIGTTVMIGDGMTDAMAWLEGGADYFVGFGIHALRKKVEQVAPHFFTDMESLRSHLFTLVA